MELMEEGDLSDVIMHRKGNLSEDFCKYSLYQVALGLDYMHSHNILHRSIKSDDVLCRANGEIKIGDLGYSVLLTEQQPNRKD